MKRTLLFLYALLMAISGAWAQTATWTSGVSLLTASSTGDYTTGWFSMVMPASGTMTYLRINLGTGSRDRKDAYLAISKDLKSTTTGFSASDFVAISTNKCGTSDYDVTMTFNSGDLVGGSTYYFYWLTESNGTYTTVQQRYCMGNQNQGVKMSIGSVGSTTAQSTAYDPRFSCEMSVKDNVYYRMRALYPDDICYLYSNSSNENKIFKIVNASTSLVTSRYVWKTTLGAKGIYIQNVGNSHYIAKINGSNDGATFLNATTIADADQFTIVANNPERDYNYSGYIALKSTTNDNSYLNCYTTNQNYVGSFTAQDNKSGQFMFQQVKEVTFSEAVAVNGGDAVSTIYVAADGSDSFTLSSSKLYSINGAAAVTNTEAVAAIAAAGTSNITVTVSDNPTRNVTYTLKWSDDTQISQVTNVVANLNASASEFLPSTMANDFVTLSYSPETITSETSEVVVTATWNGPFQLSSDVASAKWYTVGIHSSHEGANYIWKYDSDKLKAESVATDAYHLLNDANCFAFFGNPYTGINIYNKSAAKYVVKADNATQATFDATGTNFIPRASSVSGKTIANRYSCFLVSDGTFYLNCYADDNYKVNGWHDNDAGSTCWFIPAGQYYLNYIDGLALEAPIGAVGTSSYFTTVANAALAKSTLTSLRSIIADALYSDMATLATVNNQLDPVRNAGKIALTDGYYRIVNAYSSFTNKPAMYFDSSYRKIRWSVDANRENNINAIFKFARTEENNVYSIFSTNGQNYISNGGGALGSTTAITTTEAASGTAQYSFYLAEGYNNNHHYLHTLGHNSGAGTSGDLTAWDAGANTASAWYIVKIDELPLTLNEVGAASYATLYVDFPVAIPEGNESTAIYTLSESDGVYTCNKQTSVPPRTGIIIRDISKASSVTLSIPSTYNEATSALSGSFLGTTAPSNCYIFSTGEEGLGFYPYASGSALAANKAYLLTSSGIRGFALSFNDTETGISETETFAKDSKLFDLQGRHIAKPQHGIYIVNGKKVLF